ncbi:acetamidase/formamidase family protein [Nocardioides sp. zg-536]|uniref:Acetamidase/formamidase family protein n=1 Tax=Nocardioides faecalis TaxID=2803858 RepID=A0A938Y698_9ACTN|nr:acetamidase/formamidase family protein [Nocardioides faecalis]QVI58790.1 acetamidase/formamidase family protein [Nocardioides faecalis]
MSHHRNEPETPARHSGPVSQQTSPRTPRSAALQPGTGPIRSATYLPAEPDTVLWGRLPCGTDTPVLTVEPGTEVTIDTISHEGILEDQGRDPRRFFTEHGAEEVLTDAIALAAADVPRTFGVDGPHVVSRPIQVTGARAGDLLAITILETLPRVPYGVISNRHAKGALPDTYPLDGAAVHSEFVTIADDHAHLGPARFPLAPFLGIMGVAVDGDERPHSVPPGPHGGNIDIRMLTVGSTLYLPIQVDGAMAYVGDPHFAQGDGEVSLTALEASLRATVRFDVLAREEAVAQFGELVGPLAATDELLIPTGMDPDLDVAVQNCVRAAIALLQARYGMSAPAAYAYLSAATDFHISQVVDVVKGVHAAIRRSDFPDAGGL